MNSLYISAAIPSKSIQIQIPQIPAKFCSDLPTHDYDLV